MFLNVLIGVLIYLFILWFDWFFLLFLFFLVDEFFLGMFIFGMNMGKLEKFRGNIIGGVKLGKNGVIN